MIIFDYCCREELEKEEMYVEYLDKLLSDIELHRHRTSSVAGEAEEGGSQEEAAEEEEASSLDLTVTSAKLEAAPPPPEAAAVSRSSLHLDLEPEAGQRSSAFVTVISVTAAREQREAAASSSQDTAPELQPGSKFTFTKSKSGGKKVADPATADRTAARQGSRESLASVSSPLSPASPASLPDNPLAAPREAPASPRELLGGEESSDTASPPSTQTKQRGKPEPPARSISIKESVAETKSNSSSEDIDLGTSSRGRPDGGETDESLSASLSLPPAVSGGASSDPAAAASKVKDLRANWENKPPISAKPALPAERRSAAAAARDSSLARDPGVASPPAPRRQLSKQSTRTDSDSSSRGRMGSPSGKSHDSSDGEHSWGRASHRPAPAPAPAPARRRQSGETRLERLVRRPSGERPGPAPPALPKPRKLGRKWSASEQEGGGGAGAEPLYDTVAAEEPEDEYDNHLLYGATQPGTKAAGEAASSPRSLTLSSTDTENISGSPSLLRKVVTMDDEESNYVNIQYFLHHTKSRSKLDREKSVEDGEESEDEAASDSRSPNNNSLASTRSRERSVGEAERQLMYRHILNSIADSEAIYLECLSVSLQYMKAMKVTLSTPQPVIPKEDFDVIFFKIPELHEFHHHYHENLKKQVERYTAEDKVGHHFKMLAQQTKVYAQFLGNYPAALDTLHKCTQLYPQFADLTGSIKLRTLKGQQQSQSLSLEDLLHKPVARVQKNCLSLQDLIKYTPEQHPDHATLTDSLHMIQNFLNDYNVAHRGELYPAQEPARSNQRHLVKNSFTVELADGARKLRHLFLFNDVLVCAKYKASGRGGGEKFTFQLKWYIPLCEVSWELVLYTIHQFHNRFSQSWRRPLLGPSPC